MSGDHSVSIPYSINRSQIESELDAVASKLGGREALISYLLGDGQAQQANEVSALNGDDRDARSRKSNGIHIALRLSPDELRRIDQESESTKYTRSRWVAALIRRALYGKAQFNRPDRIYLSNIAADLKAIDRTTIKSMKALENLELSIRECLERMRNMEEVRERLAVMAAKLEAAVDDNDAYWNSVTDGVSVDQDFSAEDPDED